MCVFCRPFSLGRLAFLKKKSVFEIVFLAYRMFVQIFPNGNIHRQQSEPVSKDNKLRNLYIQNISEQIAQTKFVFIKLISHILSYSIVHFHLENKAYFVFKHFRDLSCFIENILKHLLLHVSSMGLFANPERS